jgi:hypothetical protein
MSDDDEQEKWLYLSTLLLYLCLSIKGEFFGVTDDRGDFSRDFQPISPISTSVGVC